MTRAAVLLSLALSTFGRAAVAQAAPTYLACALNDAKGPLDLNITADETNQQATIEVPSTGSVHRIPAVFAASQLSFTLPVGSVASFYYQISRTDLTIKRALTIGGGFPTVVSGTCRVQDAPKRAF